MNAEAHPEPAVGASPTPRPQVAAPVELSPAERRARRILITGLVVAGLLLLGVIVLLVLLSLNAYQMAMAGAGPSPGEVVVALVRDAAIVFVAFETLIIGVLLIILMLQIRSLVVLLRDEIMPMLDAANETMATVRGTTRFVGENVVTPVMKWSGYIAGLQRMLREIVGLSKTVSD